MLGRLLWHLFLLVAFSPLLLGVISRVKALVAGRRGAPLYQPYLDLWKLSQKQVVLSRTTTPVFRAAPVVSLVAPLLASLYIPFGNLAAPLSFAGDAVFFVYLFALARFFLVLSALDTGSAFEGMGAAREAAFSCLVEPIVFMALVALVRLSGGYSLGGMLHGFSDSPTDQAGLVIPLLAASLFIVLLAENSRIPFDDPETHLELTMIHEVMILDHSGSDLGLIQQGGAMKLFVMGALIIGLLPRPASGGFLADAALFMAWQTALAVSIGLVESSMARLRLFRVPQLLVGGLLLSAFAFILLLM